MELLVQLVERFSEVWRAVNHAPMPFSAVGITIFLIGYGMARWYYRREVRVLSALSALLEERIKRDEQQNTRLAALLQPRTGEAFFAIHRAPGHKIAVPYSPAQVTARPEYRLFSELRNDHDRGSCGESNLAVQYICSYKTLGHVCGTKQGGGLIRHRRPQPLERWITVSR